jgi:hypothetical protein
MDPASGWSAPRAPEEHRLSGRSTLPAPEWRWRCEAALEFGSFIAPKHLPFAGLRDCGIVPVPEGPGTIAGGKRARLAGERSPRLSEP